MLEWNVNSICNSNIQEYNQNYCVPQIKKIMNKEEKNMYNQNYCGPQILEYYGW